MVGCGDLFNVERLWSGSPDAGSAVSVVAESIDACIRLLCLVAPHFEGGQSVGGGVSGYFYVQAFQWHGGTVCPRCDAGSDAGLVAVQCHGVCVHCSGGQSEVGGNCGGVTLAVGGGHGDAFSVSGLGGHHDGGSNGSISSEGECQVSCFSFRAEFFRYQVPVSGGGCTCQYGCGTC